MRSFLRLTCVVEHLYFSNHMHWRFVLNSIFLCIHLAPLISPLLIFFWLSTPLLPQFPFYSSFSSLVGYVNHPEIAYLSLLDTSLASALFVAARCLGTEKITIPDPRARVAVTGSVCWWRPRVHSFWTNTFLIWSLLPLISSWNRYFIQYLHSRPLHCYQRILKSSTGSWLKAWSFVSSCYKDTSLLDVESLLVSCLDNLS